MNLIQKKKFILETLEELFPEPEIPLHHTDPFTLLIAVVLSARCTDARVNQITPALFALAKTPEKMKEIPVETVQAVIRPCGLSPQKSKAIVGLSKIIFEQYNSKVPADMQLLEQLPGVGHKTASVIMSQAFGVPSFPVDTHIHRMMERWKISNGKSVIQTEKDAKSFFPENTWNKVHLQIIYYARAFSPARVWDIEKDVISRTINYF